MIARLAALILLPGAVFAQDPNLIAAAATPIFAPGTYGEPFADTGLSQGCTLDQGQAVCTITSRGANLIATGDVGTEAPLALLSELPPNTPVAMTGDIVSYGDITAEIFLSTVEIGDADPHAPVLAALQGAWVSVDDAAYTIDILGTEKIDAYGGEVQGYYLISLQDQCPDGATSDGGTSDGGTSDGPMLVAQLMGGDPVTDSFCYALLVADGAQLQMSLMGGNGTSLTFTRP